MRERERERESQSRRRLTRTAAAGLGTTGKKSNIYGFLSLPPSLPPSARRVGVSKSESSLDGDRAIQTANLKSQCIMQCRRRDIQDNASLADVHCPLDVWRTCTWSVRRPIRMHDKQRHFPTVQKPEREGGREGGRGRYNVDVLTDV